MVERGLAGAVLGELPVRPDVVMQPIPEYVTEKCKANDRADLEFSFAGATEPKTFDTTVVNTMAKSNTPRKAVVVLRAKFKKKTEKYEGAYADFSPYVVNILGSPCPDSRGALRAFVKNSLSRTVTGLMDADDVAVSRVAAAIRLRTAFAVVRALGEELFRNSRRGQEKWWRCDGRGVG